MAYPPNTLPSNRSNTTPQFDNHPADHNAIADAVTDIVNELGANPSLGQPTVQEVIQNLIDTKVNKSGDTMTGALTGTTASYSGQVTAAASQNSNWAFAGNYVRAGLSPSAGDDPATGTSVGVQIGNTGRIVSSMSETFPNLLCRRLVPANANGEFIIRFAILSGNTYIGSITVATQSSVAFNTSSDPRLKERIADLDDAATRTQILGRQAYRGSFTRDPNANEWDMLDATAIREVAPYAVHGEPDAVHDDGEIDGMEVDYSKLVPLLFSSLANALDRIDELEARID